MKSYLYVILCLSFIGCVISGLEIYAAEFQSKTNKMSASVPVMYKISTTTTDLIINTNALNVFVNGKEVK